MLMMKMIARATTKSPSTKPLSPTPNSSCEELDDECDDGVDYDEEASLAFMISLKGESLTCFRNLMKSLAEHDD